MKWGGLPSYKHKMCFCGNHVLEAGGLSCFKRGVTDRCRTSQRTPSSPVLIGAQPHRGHPVSQSWSVPNLTEDTEFPSPDRCPTSQRTPSSPVLIGARTPRRTPSFPVLIGAQPHRGHRVSQSWSVPNLTEDTEFPSPDRCPTSQRTPSFPVLIGAQPHRGHPVSQSWSVPEPHRGHPVSQSWSVPNLTEDTEFPSPDQCPSSQRTPSFPVLAKVYCNYRQRYGTGGGSLNGEKRMPRLWLGARSSTYLCTRNWCVSIAGVAWSEGSILLPWSPHTTTWSPHPAGNKIGTSLPCQSDKMQFHRLNILL